MRVLRPTRGGGQGQPLGPPRGERERDEEGWVGEGDEPFTVE